MTEPGDSPSHGSDEIAAADAAAEAAEARAEAARAKADELRRRLASDEAEPVPAGSPGKPAGRILRRLAVAGAVAAILALLSGTGYMLLLHRKAEAERHRTAEFAAAGRQAAVNLMSMDFNSAKDIVQRLVDDSTGKFKVNLQDTSKDLIKAMQDSKAITKVTVNDVAVESHTDDSGVVLVAASSNREGPNATKADQQPRVWRVVLTLDRDDGRLKLSDVEFQ